MNTYTLMIASLLGLTACSSGQDSAILTCTEIGCSDGLNINFEVTDPGQWVFVLERVQDGDVQPTVTCTATLPIDTGAADGCDDPSVYLTLYGSELPNEEQRISGLMLMSQAPETIDVRVTLDAAEVLSTTLHPTYEEIAPNGVECGPVCTTGASELPL